MAAALGERVVLGRPVRRIEHAGHGVRVIARDGSEYRGDAAVVTLPPTLAGRLEYDPPLPSWRDQLTQRMPAARSSRPTRIYPEPFWRNDGLNGYARLGCRTGKGDLRQLAAVGPARGLDGLHRGQGGADMGPSQRGRTAGRRDRLLRPLFRPGGGTPRAVRGAGLEAEEFTRGCYGAHFAPGVGRPTARRGAHPPGASTGQAPSVPRGGTAIWKAPSAAAKPPRDRSPAASARADRGRPVSRTAQSPARPVSRCAVITAIRGRSRERMKPNGCGYEPGCHVSRCPGRPIAAGFGIRIGRVAGVELLGQNDLEPGGDRNGHERATRPSTVPPIKAASSTAAASG